jgi:hypothetical protein
LRARRKAEWRADRPTAVLKSHPISGSHRCKQRVFLFALSPARACSHIIISQVVTASVAKSLRSPNLVEGSCPHAARHIPRCSTFYRHASKLQETSFEHRMVAPGNADIVSSKHNDPRRRCRRGALSSVLAGRPRCSRTEASCHRRLTRRLGRGRGGGWPSERRRSLSAGLLLSGSESFAIFGDFLSQAEALTFIIYYTSRIVRVILAQGRCEYSPYRVKCYA